ncbi:hypothetical protein IAT38_005849 [Cryptococcus sp. DSM 104549]
MPPLILLPSTSNAFSAYQPSSNAHTDYIVPQVLGKRGARSTVAGGKEGGRTVKLVVPAPPPPPPHELLPALFSAVKALLNGKPTPHSYHHISALCHTLSFPPNSRGHAIRECIKNELESRQTAELMALKRSIMARDKGTLGRVAACWQVWIERADRLAAVFVYLDRAFGAGDDTEELSIRRIAIDTFQLIWTDRTVRDAVEKEIWEWSQIERKSGEEQLETRATLIELSRMLADFPKGPRPRPGQTTSVDSNRSLWVPSYIGAIKNLYRKLATRATRPALEAGDAPASDGKGGNDDDDNILVPSTLTPTEYISWLTNAINSEVARALAVFGPRAATAVLSGVHGAGWTVSFPETQPRLLRPAMDEAMDSGDAAALRRLWEIAFEERKNPPEFASAMGGWVFEKLKKVIGDPGNEGRMIEETLAVTRLAESSAKALLAVPTDASAETVKERTGLINARLGDGDGLTGHNQNSPDPFGSQTRLTLTPHPSRAAQFALLESLRTAFKAALSSRQNAPAEWIAKYLDAAMRRGQGSGTEEEFDKHLDEIIALVGYTPDKDVFKAFYASGLAKRLLLGRSASDDMEKTMILKLQKEMGDEFTTGDVMMKDLQLSETLAKAYQVAQAKNPEEYKDSGNFTANVLTESAWPAYPLLKDGWNFTLPPSLQHSVSTFTDWYATQHKNRQLSWRFQLATVTLTARFPSGRFELGVSLFQAVVLMLFNEEDALGFGEIKERTGIESKELVRTLQSLALGRKGTRVLVKKPAGKEVLPTDTFAWNKGFTSEKIKFKINQIQQDLSVEESRKTNEQVALDRVSILEATIVRIMKARKTLSLQLLIDAVVSDVVKRFPPDVKEIKKRVESLIEREFMGRDEEDRGVLNYIA